MHGINYFAVTQSELIICILNCYNLSYFADVSLVILCYLWPDEENAMFSKTLALFLLICVLFMLNESCPSCVVIFHQIKYISRTLPDDVPPETPIINGPLKWQQLSFPANILKEMQRK